MQRTAGFGKSRCCDSTDRSIPRSLNQPGRLASAASSSNAKLTDVDWLGAGHPAVLIVKAGTFATQKSAPRIAHSPPPSIGMTAPVR
jgi:hypothetical protein